MRDLLVVAGVIVVLVLLLAVFVEPAQTGRMRFLAPLGMTGWGGTSGTFETRQVEPGHSLLGMTAGGGASGTSATRQVEPGRSLSGPVGHAGREEEISAFVCLALVGGTALLAGGVWVGRLRRLVS